VPHTKFMMFRFRLLRSSFSRFILLTSLLILSLRLVTPYSLSNLLSYLDNGTLFTKPGSSSPFFRAIATRSISTSVHLVLSCSFSSSVESDQFFLGFSREEERSGENAAPIKNKKN